MAAALAGCKIMKEMAHLESEAESARSMKEAKYEQFALGEKWCHHVSILHTALNYTSQFTRQTSPYYKYRIQIIKNK